MGRRLGPLLFRNLWLKFKIVLPENGPEFMGQHFNFWFSTILSQDIDFWRTFRALAKIWMFGQIFDFLSKIPWWDSHLWHKLRFLTKITIFDQNYDFWPKLRFLTKISIFDKTFVFLSKIPSLVQTSIIYEKFRFLL